MYPSFALSVTKPMLCVGRLTVDIVETCEELPEKGSKQSSLEARWQRGGHGGNVSCVLRMLGAQVEFLGVLSRSPLLREFVLDMERRCIGLSHCPRTDRSPAFSTIVTGRKSGCRNVLHCSKNFPNVTMEDFAKLDISNYGWVHFEAHNKLDTIRMMRAVLDYNNGRQERVQISVKVDSFYQDNIDLFDMCDYVIFSRQLALDLGWLTPEETCIQLDKNLSLPRSINSRRPCFICSWGAQGAGCLDKQGSYFELPLEAHPKPLDTYGVGECFTAGVLYALCVRQMPLAGAVAFGNRVAVHKTTRLGYDHIGDLEVYPVELGEPTQEIKGRSDNVFEDDEDENVICRKYLNRQITPSDGKLATQLLQRFDPASCTLHSAEHISEDSEPDAMPALKVSAQSVVPSSIMRSSFVSRKSGALRASIRRSLKIKSK